MKHTAYESLFIINQATEQLVEQIEILKTDGLLTPEVAQLHALSAEELRSVVCASIAISLHDQEMDKAIENQTQRVEIQKQLANT